MLAVSFYSVSGDAAFWSDVAFCKLIDYGLVANSEFDASFSFFLSLKLVGDRSSGDSISFSLSSVACSGI